MPKKITPADRRRDGHEAAACTSLTQIAAAADPDWQKWLQDPNTTVSDWFKVLKDREDAAKKKGKTD